MQIHCETSLLREMHERSRAAVPDEACGLLAGEWTTRGWHLNAFVGTRNLHSGPGGFALDPLEFLRVESRFRSEGHELCGLFHSHPGGSIELSARDRQLGWTELIHLVCALGQNHRAEFAAWRLLKDCAVRLDFQTMPS